MSSFQPTKKAMSKDEASLLMDLIRATPILTSKLTNAATNQQKDEAWAGLTRKFNIKTGTLRTKDQLKSKWDNMKKAARKRHAEMRMKAGGGKPNFIPPDELLDRVAGTIGSTCIGTTSIVVYDDDMKNYYNEAEINIPDCEVIAEDSTGFTRKRKIEDEESSSNSSNFFGTLQKDKKNVDPEGQLARNLAMAKYYEKKTEKLELEIKLLKLELEKKESAIVS